MNSFLIKYKYNSNEKLSSELFSFLQEFKFSTKCVKTSFLQESFKTKNIPVVHDGNCSLRLSYLVKNIVSTFSDWVNIDSVP